MRRFLVFPLVLGITGTFLPFVCWAEGVTITNDFNYAYVFIPAGQIDAVWESSYILGFVTGIGVGLLAAIWDLIRNRRDQSAMARLLPNLFWCGFYASLLITVNGILFVTLSFFTIDPRPLLSNFGVLPILLGIAVPNFTAILWAAIRSITTKDILTPRVLRAKLRERLRLQ